jgi:hypothetical protein
MNSSLDPILCHFKPLHTLKSTFLMCILILSFRQHLSLASSFLLSGHPIKILYTFLIYHMHATVYNSRRQNIIPRKQITTLPIMFPSLTF